MTPTPTPTRAPPTPTPGAQADPDPDQLADVRIRAEDLPPGFFPIDLSMFGMDLGAFTDDEESIQNSSSLMSMCPIEIVISFLIQAEDAEPVIRFLEVALLLEFAQVGRIGRFGVRSE